MRDCIQFIKSNTCCCFFQYWHAWEIRRMTEDGTDCSLSVGLIDSLVTTPMFNQQLDGEQSPDTCQKPSGPSLCSWQPSPPCYFKSVSFSCELSARFSVGFQTILRLFCGSPPPPHDVMTKKTQTNCRFDELKNLCEELLSSLCTAKMSTLIIQLKCR